MTSEILVEGIGYSYGGSQVLSGCSLVIKPGRLLGLLGPNGAGKTTLLEILARQRRPQKGKIRVRDLNSWTEVRVGWAGAEPVFFDEISFRDFVVSYLAPALGVEDPASRSEELARRLGIRESIGLRPREMSHGTRMKAACLMAVLEPPDLLILDEPYTGLDVHAIDKLHELIRGEVVGNSVCAILSEHRVDALDDVDDVAFMHAGRIVLCKPAIDVRREYGDLISAYRQLIPHGESGAGGSY